MPDQEETIVKCPAPAVAYQLVSSRGIHPTLSMGDNHFELYSAYDYEIPPYGGRAYIVFDLKLRPPPGRYIRLMSRLGLALYNGVVMHAGTLCQIRVDVLCIYPLNIPPHLKHTDNMSWFGNTGVLLFNFSDAPFYVYRGMHVVDAICEVFSRVNLVEIPMEARIHSGGPPNPEQGFHNYLLRTDFAEGRNPIPQGFVDEYGPEWGSSVYHPKDHYKKHSCNGNALFFIPKKPDYATNYPPRPLPPPVYQATDSPINDLLKINDDYTIRNLNTPPKKPVINTSVPPPEPPPDAEFVGATI